jgi:hypothetical protein
MWLVFQQQDVAVLLLTCFLVYGLVQAGKQVLR